MFKQLTVPASPPLSREQVVGVVENQTSKQVRGLIAVLFCVDTAAPVDAQTCTFKDAAQLKQQQKLTSDCKISLSMICYMLHDYNVTDVKYFLNSNCR